MMMYIIILIIFIVVGFIVYSLLTNNEYNLTLIYTITLLWKQLTTFISGVFNGASGDQAIQSDFEKVYKYLGVPPSQRNSYFCTASTVLNKNGKELLFVGGGEDQKDALLEYNPETKTLNNVARDYDINGNGPTYAAVTFDMNGTGDSDIVVARQSGIYVYVNNGSGAKFKERQIWGPFEDSVPTSLAIGDFNKNKLPDIYVTMFPPSKVLKAFQFNNPDHVRTNLLLQNMGDMKFKDVTEEMGVKGYQNSFTAVWVDLGSGWPDLLVANDTGKPELFKNNQGKSFTKIPLDVPNGFWMGIAVGDYNNDGNLDFFFTNVGDTLPLTESGGIRGNPDKGGLKPGQKITNKHLLLKNEGNYKFKNVSDQQNVADYGFGWGCVFEDINLDGNLDLLFAQNYVDLPHLQLLPGAVLFNDGNKFTRKMRYENRNYAQTPVLLDLNGDGIKDIAWVNMKGPVVAYINENENKNNFINVRLPDKIEYVNATVKLYYNGKTQMRQNIIGGVGFSGDQSHLLSFGLGKNKKVDKITIKTIYGKDKTIMNPKINQTFYVDS